MPDLDHGHAPHRQPFGCEKTAVSNHHIGSIIDHDRHDEPKLADTVSNLLDLILRMMSRIAGIQNQIGYVAILNLNLDQTRIRRSNSPSARGFCSTAD